MKQILLQFILCASFTFVWAYECLAQPLLTFQSGEIVPVYALKVERTKGRDLRFTLPKKADPNKARILLESKLKGKFDVKVSLVADSVLSLTFQGPDTPLLEAISQIDMDP